jgi:hypothetical protein
MGSFNAEEVDVKGEVDEEEEVEGSSKDEEESSNWGVVELGEDEEIATGYGKDEQLKRKV